MQMLSIVVAGVDEEAIRNSGANKSSNNQNYHLHIAAYMLRASLFDSYCVNSIELKTVNFCAFALLLYINKGGKTKKNMNSSVTSYRGVQLSSYFNALLLWILKQVGPLAT